MKQSRKATDLTRGIQTWYKERCDGDWEHSYGVAITTLDNPGWNVEIDLADTPWDHVTKNFFRDERTDSDWVQYEIKNGRFVGSGGITNLSEILQIFLQIVEPAT
jgi:hypothetical protein